MPHRRVSNTSNRNHRRTCRMHSDPAWWHIFDFSRIATRAFCVLYANLCVVFELSTIKWPSGMQHFLTVLVPWWICISTLTAISYFLFWLNTFFSGHLFGGEVGGFPWQLETVGKWVIVMGTTLLTQVLIILINSAIRWGEN